MNRLFPALCAALCTILCTPTAVRAQQEPLDAAASDPARTGYMQGFPPPDARRIRVRDGSFFRFPALRYSVVHMRSFLPTVNVARNNRTPPALFEYALDAGIDTVTFLPAGQREAVTWRRSLDLNYTDGILVLHRGRIVYERYLGALTEEGVHAVMSVTKSLTGTLAALLAAEGVLDPAERVSHYLPQLAGSGFGDATVREVMDMTTSIRFSEDYRDPEAEVWANGEAGNPLLEHPAGTPQGYYDYLRTIRRAGRHGNVFGYRTVNADLLGWIVATVSGRSVAELLEERIWSRLGMEQDGYYQVDALGTPFAGGGFNAALRDLGRFGEMIRLGGRWRGERILPPGGRRGDSQRRRPRGLRPLGIRPGAPRLELPRHVVGHPQRPRRLHGPRRPRTGDLHRPGGRDGDRAPRLPSRSGQPGHRPDHAARFRGGGRLPPGALRRTSVTDSPREIWFFGEKKLSL